MGAKTCRGEHPSLAGRLGVPENTVFQPAGVSYLSSSVGSEITVNKRPAAEAMRDAVGRLTREGLVLSDPDVLHAMSISGDPQIIGDGKSASKKALSKEGFAEMFQTLEQTIARIAHHMKSGDAKAAPQPHDGRIPCQYCAFSPICRAAQKTNQ